MAIKHFLLPLLTSILLYLYLTSPPTPQFILTHSGSVQGSIGTSRDGRPFFQWLKIPYALPPVGPLKFASPKARGKWEGVLDGTTLGPSCVQFGHTGIEGDEDCLHLNVYVPKIEDLKEKPLLPVLVWIHGGAFVAGGGVHYGADYFMDEDVILITINYRINLFGFMSTGDGEIRGNMGLKDQFLALKWIHDNVQFFHGDPGKVTIFGESAGAASCHHQTLSQKTKGLFQKAVSMSGLASVPWAFRSAKRVNEETKEFARRINCPTDNSKVMADCLKNLSAVELMGAYKKDWDEIFIFDPTRHGDFLAPVVETINDSEAFLTETPYEILIQGKSQRIPWLTGVVADEGLMTSLTFVRDASKLKKMEENWSGNIEFCLSLGTLPVEQRTEICAKLKEFYFPKGKTDNQKIEGYTRLFSEGFFSTYISQTAAIQRQFSPVYLYHLNKTGGPTFATHFSGVQSEYLEVGEHPLFGLKAIFNKFMGRAPKSYGMVHADDYLLLFPHFNFWIPQNEGNDIYQFSKSLVNLIYQFAVDEKSMKFRQVPFPATPKEGKLKYLSLTEKPKMVDEPLEKAIKFWQSLDILSKYSNVVKQSTLLSRIEADRRKINIEPK